MRTFGAWQNFNWEDPNWESTLRAFGDLVHYDWSTHGYDQYDPRWHYRLKQAMNQELFVTLRDAHAEKPVDLFFGYLCGRLIFRGYIEALHLLKIPSLNIALDDKTHHYSFLEPTGFAGQVDIASAFDLSWTSDPASLEWYGSIGAHAIFLPEGANPDVFVARDCERDIPAVFVGRCYGRRVEMVEELRSLGVDVLTYGMDWPNGPATTEQLVDLVNRAQVTLGFGETPNIERIGIKGRDFEVPMAGGLYMPQYNRELAPWWQDGLEIVTWETIPQLAEHIRYYQAHQTEGEEIRHRAAARARREHTWRHRFEIAFREMGL